MRLLFLAVWIPLLALTACAPQLRTDVTRYHSLAAPPVGRSFVILPGQDQVGSLAFAHYAALVGDALTRQGLLPLPVDPSSGKPAADLLVFLRYGGAGTRTEIDDRPVGGPWRGGRGWWGPSGEEVSAWTVYSQFFDLQMLDGPSWRQGKWLTLFETHVIGDSSVRDLNTTMPYLVQAAFTHFPGPSGITERLAISMENNEP